MNLSALYELKCILLKMEDDLGLNELSETERNVYLSACMASEEHGAEFTSEQIRKKNLLSDVSQATFNRTLKSLVEGGFLGHAAGYKSKVYVIIK